MSEVTEPTAAQQSAVVQQQKQYEEAQFLARAQVLNEAVAGVKAQQLAAPPTDIREGLMKPFWVDGELLLARQVSVGDVAV